MRRASTSSASAWRCVTATVLLLCSLVVCASCATETVVIRPSEDVVHLERGIPAPYDGWLLTDEQMVEIYDALGRKLGEK